MPQPEPSRDFSPRFYAVLSLVSFLVAIALFGMMLGKAEDIARFGLTGRLFYLVMIPTALAAAAFLFGALRSVAAYRGRAFGGTIELGCPIVAAAMVVLGFSFLPRPEPAFSAIVLVRGPDGHQDATLKGQGRVVLDLNGNRRSEAIDEKGAAHFPGIPASFLGAKVPVALDAAGYEIAGAADLQLDRDAIYLPVRKSAATLSGDVFDERGAPVAGATVTVEETSTETDTRGSFAITIPGEQLKTEMWLSVTHSGFRAWGERVVPGSNRILIRLQRHSN